MLPKTTVKKEAQVISPTLHTKATALTYICVVYKPLDFNNMFSNLNS